MDEKPAIITMKHVELWYDQGTPMEVHALKDVTLQIEKGDYVSFFGPSGCGKTTMLYAIAGIDKYQTGEVMINGLDMTGLTKYDLALFRQKGIGIVFQQFNLIPSLSVLQNVALPMAFLGTPKEKAEENAKVLLERLNLTPYAHRYPFELSGGQQQRVGIARALANDPPIIIADEPLGNLDSTNAQKVLEFLKELNEKDGRTIIMVTHEAWSLRDVKTIFYMKDGTITGMEKTANSTVEESLKKHLAEQLGGTKDGSDFSRATTRVLANFLLRGYSVDEIYSFELVLTERLFNKIDSKEFYTRIHKPVASGGCGLWKQKAKRIVSYVERVMDVQKDVHKVLARLEDEPELSIQDEVYAVRNWLFETDEGSRLPPDQIKAFDNALSDRMKGFVTAEQFVRVLSLEQSKSGVGLTLHRAKIIGERLEDFLTDEYEDVTLRAAEKK